MTSINIINLPYEIQTLIKYKMLMPDDSDILRDYKFDLKVKEQEVYYKKLIERITNICSFKAFDKESHMNKMKHFLDCYKTKMILIFGNDISTMKITHTGYTDVLKYCILDICKYMTRIDTKHILNYILQHFELNFSNDIIYNEFAKLCKKIKMTTCIPNINDRTSIFGKYFQINNVETVSEVEFVNNVISICEFIQYINNNISQFDEHLINTILSTVIDLKFKTIGIKLINELNKSLEFKKTMINLE